MDWTCMGTTKISNQTEICNEKALLEFLSPTSQSVPQLYIDFIRNTVRPEFCPDFTGSFTNESRQYEDFYRKSEPLARPKFISLQCRTNLLHLENLLDQRLLILAVTGMKRKNLLMKLHDGR